jgi:hypothetical protein
LDQHILECRELRAETIPGSALQLREAVGHAEVKELHEFRGESIIETGVAVEGLGGPLIVDVAELVKRALKVDPRLEDDGQEEGDRVDLAIATSEPALLGEAGEGLRGIEFEQSVLQECRRKLVWASSRGRAHSGSSWRDV